MDIKRIWKNSERVFTFRTDTYIGASIFKACEAYYGPNSEWSDFLVYRCYFLCRNIAENLTVDDLSLKAVKAAATPARMNSMHPVIYEFYRIVRDHYNNDDKVNFNAVMDALEGRGESFHVLFHEDVTDFNHVAFNCTYKMTFYPIKANNESLAILMAKFLEKTEWRCDYMVSRERFNRFLSLVEYAIDKQGITSMREIGGETFLLIADEIHRRYEQYIPSSSPKFAKADDIRRKAFTDLLKFFRFGYETGTFKKTLPFVNPDILYTQSFNYFFLGRMYQGSKCLYVAKFRDYPDLIFLNLQIYAPKMRKIMQDILLSGNVSRVDFTTIRDTFHESLGGEEAIAEMTELTEQTLNRQMEFYCNRFPDRYHRTASIAALKEIYLEYDKQHDGAFFKGCQVMNYTLIASSRFVLYYRNGYKFVNYSIYNKVTGYDKVVFMTMGLNRYTKKQHTRDLISIDFTGIEDAEYREMALAFVQSTPQRLYHKSANSVIWRFFNILSKCKAYPGWPSPDKHHFSLYDGIRIMDAFKSNIEATQHAAVFAIKDVLKWARESGQMVVDDAAFLILKSKQRQMKSNTEFVPDEHLSKIAQDLAEKGKENPIYKEALVIFILSCMTPLRISAICSLRRNELVYNEELESYIIRSTSKISGGHIVDTVIGKESSNLLKKALEIGWRLSEGCPDEDIRSYIFTYKDKCGYSVFNVTKFRKIIERSCRENDLPVWEPRNLRATYMTKAYLKASENGVFNEFTLKALSYHKRIGTTLTHYVNQSEALARLTDSLERQSSWKKTILPDEIKAVKDVIAKYEELIAATQSEEEKAILETELELYRNNLEE